MVMISAEGMRKLFLPLKIQPHIHGVRGGGQAGRSMAGGSFTVAMKARLDLPGNMLCQQGPGKAKANH